MATNNPTRPTEVNVNEANISKLVGLFERAYGDIISSILESPDYSTARRVSLLNQVEAKLAKLGVDVSERLGEFIPEMYENGMDDAVNQLRDIRAKVSVDDGFSLIHQDAVLALIDDTQRSFADSMTGFKRGVQRLLSQAVKDEISQQLALGALQGDALRKIRQNIAGIIQTDGIPALVDRAGRNWSLDRYADMLIRTKFVEARNRGLANRVAENGYDLVQISDHNSEHQECAAWEGRIVSINGLTKGFPTLAQAQKDGIFHPNCKHAINVIDLDVAKQTKFWDSRTKKYTNGIDDPEIAKAFGIKPGTITPPAPLVQSSAPTEITFGKKKTVTVQVNQVEAEFLQQNQVGFDTVTGKNKSGQFAMSYKRGEALVLDSKIELNIGKLLAEGEAQQRRTFFHELGHAIDYLRYDPQNPFTRISGGMTGTSEKTKEFKQIIESGEYKKVVYDRVRDMFGNRTDEEAEQILKGSYFEHNGQRMALPYKYISYLKDTKEVFADGYAQYRTKPDELRQYAPNMYKLMEGIFNE